MLKLLSSIITFDIHLDLKYIGFSGEYNDVYTDDADLEVQTNTTGVSVKIISIHNDPDNVAPASGTNGSTLCTWVPDGTGLINIASVEGIFVIDPEGGGDSVELTLTHIGTKLPKYHIQSPLYGDYFFGGDPVPGYPPGFDFGNYRDHVQTIQVGPLVTATVTPRN